HVLVPGERELIEGASEPDARLEAQVTEMVGGERQRVSHGVADASDVLDESIDTDRRQLDPRERMHDVGPAERVGRRADRALDPADEVDPDVHLQEPKALVDAALDE